MSNAVYLIIAGALLGPIEAKFTTDPLREELTRCCIPAPSGVKL